MSTLPIFCDWITVKQKHQTHNPFHGIVSTHYDPETGITNKSYFPKSVKSKYGTNLQIKSDGETVEVSGNPYKFANGNNVQGVALDDTMNLINQEMRELELPEFTKGERKRTITASGIEITYTGAKFTRIDMTQNLKAGNSRRRDIYLEWIQTQNLNRLDKTTEGRNTYFGKGIKSRSILIYDKAKEMADKKEKSPLIYGLDKIGAIRFEVSYKKILHTRNLQHWFTVTQAKLESYFKREIQSLMKTIETIDISELPKKVIGTYAMFLQGLNPRDHMSRNIYFQHKKILKEYGIDISNVVTRLVPKKEIITLEKIQQDELIQN